MKKITALMAAFVIILTLAACGSNEPAPAPTANNGSEGASASAQEVKLVATNFQFDQETYTVKAGQPVNITLENAQGFHGVQIKGTDVKLEGKNMSSTFTPEAGTYEIICSIPCGQGHINMKAKLVVE